MLLWQWDSNEDDLGVANGDSGRSSCHNSNSRSEPPKNGHFRPKANEHFAPQIAGGKIPYFKEEREISGFLIGHIANYAQPSG